MAIIKKNMQRPDDLSSLFDGIDISMANQNITNASDLLQRVGITTFPVNLGEILAMLVITLRFEELSDDISGILDLNTNIITVEKRHPRQRQAFTIAHEIAHFCLHQNEDSLFEDKIFFRGVDANSIEYQANEFAGDLLMPREEFLNQIRSGNTTIEGLAEHFGVSTLAIRVRAKNLNLSGHGL